MTTRLRDWMIVGVVLAMVFGVAVHAPRDGQSVSTPIATPTSAPAPVFRRARPVSPPPFLLVDPRPMILYTR
jgi:hypothetical protein